MSQSQAFDSLAATYDDHFTHTQIGQYLRGLVQERLAAHFRASDHVLELGCGTGEDALWLAGRGVRVTATDVSEGMLAAARAKCAGNELVQVERLDLRELTSPPNPLSVYREGEQNPHPLTPSPLRGEGGSKASQNQFDGVFSNFGPMNCLSEWRILAGWLAARVKTGGIVGLGVMSPLCMWEPLWHGLHGDFKVAMRRWRKETIFQPLPLTPSPYTGRGNQDEKTNPVVVTYPTIGRITRDFEPHFRRVYVRGLGVFLPPSDVYGVIEKRPLLLKLLMGLERRWGTTSKLALLADHYWVEFERA